MHGGKGTFPMADVNNDDAHDLAYSIAKTISFPLNNWYLEPTGSTGQLVLAVNPIWAGRFGEAFADVEAFQQYLWESGAPERRSVVNGGGDQRADLAGLDEETVVAER